MSWLSWSKMCISSFTRRCLPSLFQVSRKTRGL
jgi:hypothetical protein